MISFSDGPAQGVNLMLRRAPYFLRVTFDGKDWDGLDQLSDSPRSDEKVYVYRINSFPTWCHVRASKPANSGVFMHADYSLFEPQPPDETLRDVVAWRKWTESQPEETARWNMMVEEEK